MYTRLLVSFYVVIFGINCALLGIGLHLAWLVILSVVNMVALFLILFQQRSLFVSVFPEERVLFSREVFSWIAIWFWSIVAYWCGSTESVQTFLLYAVLWWGVFYMIALRLFGMTPKGYRSRRYVHLCLLLLLGALLWTQSAWIARSYGDDLATTKSSIIAWWDRVWSETMALLTSTQPEDDQLAWPLPPVGAPTTWALPAEQPQALPEDTPPTSTKLFSAQERAGQVLTYSSFLPALVSVYGLVAPASQPVFAHVPPTSSLYEPYRVAYAKRMIGSYTNPASEIKCKHLMVLLWLAEWRTVTPSETIFDAYRQQAQSKGYLRGWCITQENLAHWEDLP